MTNIQFDNVAKTKQHNFDFISKKYNKKNKIPDNPINFQQGTLIFAGLALTGISIGATIGTYVFFGTVMLVGMASVIQSSERFKNIVKKSTRTIDIAFLLATLYATAILGVTVTAALTFAGLGLTLVYFPALREGRI